MVSDRLRLSLAHTASSTTYRAHLRQWLCRLVIGSETLLAYMAEAGSESTALRRLVGVRPLEGEVPRAYARKATIEALARLDTIGERRSSPLFKNIEHLASFLRISRCQRDILAFVALATVNPALRTAMGQLYDATTEYAIEVMAVVLCQNVKDVQASLFGEGSLAQSGLLVVKDEPWSMDSKVTLKAGLAQALLTEHSKPEMLLNPFFAEARRPTVDLSDFPQYVEELTMLRQYLAASIKDRRRGVNVLLYGIPGMGKTELASAIGKEIDCKIYEVQASDGYGNQASGGERASSYQLCQLFLEHRKRALVLFDELEDLFPSNDYFGTRSHMGKSWTNRLLEENPVPTIWISNAVSQIDPAHLRRFDFSIHVEAPPRSVRHRILSSATRGLGIDDSTVDVLAAAEGFSPALASKIAKVVGTVKGSGSAASRAATLVAESTLRLQGQKLLVPHSPTAGLDLSVFNTSIAAGTLADKLATTMHPIAACFFGPPGTGKTCLARLVAERAKRDFMSLAASDLLDRYVGGTEERIASAFKRAGEEGAILFIDEVESVLNRGNSVSTGIGAWRILATPGRN